MLEHETIKGFVVALAQDKAGQGRTNGANHSSSEHEDSKDLGCIGGPELSKNSRSSLSGIESPDPFRGKRQIVTDYRPK
eukprot:15485173-Heterocapsa_arctica.AAC.1